MNWLQLSPYLVTGMLLLTAVWINISRLKRRLAVKAAIRQAKLDGLPIESITSGGCSSCSGCRSCPTAAQCSSKR